eukprot:6615613-Prymnesium_polylepis.2
MSNIAQLAVCITQLLGQRAWPAVQGLRRLGGRCPPALTTRKTCFLLHRLARESPPGLGAYELAVVGLPLIEQVGGQCADESQVRADGIERRVRLCTQGLDARLCAAAVELAGLI